MSGKHRKTIDEISKWLGFGIGILLLLNFILFTSVFDLIDIYLAVLIFVLPNILISLFSLLNMYSLLLFFFAWGYWFVSIFLHVSAPEQEKPFFIFAALLSILLFGVCMVKMANEKRVRRKKYKQRMKPKNTNISSKKSVVGRIKNNERLESLSYQKVIEVLLKNFFEITSNRINSFLPNNALNKISIEPIIKGEETTESYSFMSNDNVYGEFNLDFIDEELVNARIQFFLSDKYSQNKLINKLKKHIQEIITIDETISFDLPLYEYTLHTKSGLVVGLRKVKSGTSISISITKREYMLIDRGADVNAKNEDGITVLMLAAYSNENPEVVEVLLDRGADVNAKNKDGATALMKAASYNNPEVVETLLDRGAGVDARDEDGITVLMLAAYSNENPEVVEVLLDRGAGVDARDKGGHTALMAAAISNNNPKVINVLLDNGADGTLKNNNGKTAFDYAQENEHLKGRDVYWRLNDAQYE